MQHLEGVNHCTWYDIAFHNIFVFCVSLSVITVVLFVSFCPFVYL